MPSLKDIRSRINSTKNTQQITRAMKMVSAAKLRRAQDQIMAMRPYSRKILSVISDIASTGRASHPLLELRENPKSILLIAITSDRGLCGGFNNSINRYTEKYVKSNKANYDRLDTIFIGKKSADYFRQRDVNILDAYTNMAREISFEYAEVLAKRCMDAYLKGGYDEVRFVYNEFESAISQKLTVETLLPVDLSNTSFRQQDELPGANFSEDLIFEPAPEEIINEMLQKHFAIQVYRCLAESVASEHAARMTAMENATSNAKDMIGKLTLTYNKLRQAAITRELIEICSGAEAINSN